MNEAEARSSRCWDREPATCRVWDPSVACDQHLTLWRAQRRTFTAAAPGRVESACPPRHGLDLAGACFALGTCMAITPDRRHDVTTVRIRLLLLRAGSSPALLATVGVFGARHHPDMPASVAMDRSVYLSVRKV